MSLQLTIPELGKFTYGILLIIELIIFSVVLYGNSSLSSNSICVPGIIGLIINIVYVGTTLRRIYSIKNWVLVIRVLAVLTLILYIISFSFLWYAYFYPNQLCYISSDQVHALARVIVINVLACFVPLWEH